MTWTLGPAATRGAAVGAAATAPKKRKKLGAEQEEARKKRQQDEAAELTSRHYNPNCRAARNAATGRGTEGKE